MENYLKVIPAHLKHRQVRIMGFRFVIYSLVLYI